MLLCSYVELNKCEQAWPSQSWQLVKKKINTEWRAFIDITVDTPLPDCAEEETVTRPRVNVLALTTLTSQRRCSEYPAEWSPQVPTTLPLPARRWGASSPKGQKCWRHRRWRRDSHSRARELRETRCTRSRRTPALCRGQPPSPLQWSLKGPEGRREGSIYGDGRGQWPAQLVQWQLIDVVFRDEKTQLWNSAKSRWKTKKKPFQQVANRRQLYQKTGNKESSWH